MQYLFWTSIWNWHLLFFPSFHKIDLCSPTIPTYLKLLIWIPLLSHRSEPSLMLIHLFFIFQVQGSLEKHRKTGGLDCGSFEFVATERNWRDYSSWLCVPCTSGQTSCTTRALRLIHCRLQCSRFTRWKCSNHPSYSPRRGSYLLTYLLLATRGWPIQASGHYTWYLLLQHRVESE